jgi:FKBP-type peptidyl-prolyl cis-trans isomerase FklB
MAPRPPCIIPLKSGGVSGKDRAETNMKTLFYSLALVGWVAFQAAAADQTVLTDPKQKLSYTMGMNLGNSWKAQDIDVDMEFVARAVKDVMSGNPTLISESEAREIITAYSKELRTKQEEKRKVQGEKNKTEGAAFLAENKGKPGVVTLPSGLQYKVMTEGKGEIPKATDMVKVNYRGTLIDGTEFDSSIKRGQPAVFGVNRVVKGWTEALQLIKVGSKWQLFIPADLAYGEMGSGRIAPNATLIFEVELLAIETPTPPAVANQPITSDIIKVPSAEELKKGAKIEVIKAEDANKK